MQHIEFTQQAPDGVQFYFQGWQPETPPKAVVCLVHGLGEHSGRYAHVAAALNDAGYALLGFDLRGHGKSGGPRGHTPSYETLMDDIGRLLAEAAAALSRPAAVPLRSQPGRQSGAELCPSTCSGQACVATWTGGRGRHQPGYPHGDPSAGQPDHPRKNHEPDSTGDANGERIGSRWAGA